MIPVCSWETNLALLIVWLMSPTQWLSGKRKEDASDFSLMLSQLVTKLPLIYLGPQQRRKLASLAFCKEENWAQQNSSCVNQNKCTDFLTKLQLISTECRLTNLFFIMKNENTTQDNIILLLQVVFFVFLKGPTMSMQSNSTEGWVLDLVYTWHAKGAL